jgi:hypothetical protein
MEHKLRLKVRLTGPDGTRALRLRLSLQAQHKSIDRRLIRAGRIAPAKSRFDSGPCLQRGAVA